MNAATPTVSYLLEDTAIFGGVKVALHHANLLTARGWDVTVVSPGPPPDWYPLRARFQRVASLADGTVPAADVTVATYWTTLAAACRVPRTQVLHFCQGYEGSFTHNVREHEAIAEAYSAPLPAMVVAPHLAELLRARFGRPAYVVPDPLEPLWRAGFRLRPRRVPRILVANPFEIDWKGVRTGLEAVRCLREGGVLCSLVRLSQWPLGDAERQLLEPDEFHHGLTPPQVARLMRGCDLLLAPSWEAEGFGLPVVEAMACGVPVVASDIAAFRYTTAGAARLVPPADAEAFAAAAREVLATPNRWREMRRLGATAAGRFLESRVVSTLEECLAWAAGGGWKNELASLGDRAELREALK